MEYVEIGDVFTVVTSYGKYTYEVYDTRIADQNDRSAFGFDSNEEIITMLHVIHLLRLLHIPRDCMYMQEKHPDLSWYIRRR